MKNTIENVQEFRDLRNKYGQISETDMVDYANLVSAQLLKDFTEEVKRKTNVWQHSRDFKTGSKAPIIRQKIMISEIDKSSIDKTLESFLTKHGL